MHRSSSHPAASGARRQDPVPSVVPSPGNCGICPSPGRTPSGKPGPFTLMPGPPSRLKNAVAVPAPKPLANDSAAMGTADTASTQARRYHGVFSAGVAPGDAAADAAAYGCGAGYGCGVAPAGPVGYWGAVAVMRSSGEA